MGFRTRPAELEVLDCHAHVGFTNGLLLPSSSCGPLSLAWPQAHKCASHTFYVYKRVYTCVSVCVYADTAMRMLVPAGSSERLTPMCSEHLTAGSSHSGRGPLLWRSASLVKMPPLPVLALLSRPPYASSSGAGRKGPD